MIWLNINGVKQLIRNKNKIKFYKKLINNGKLPRASYKEVKN